MLVFVIVTRVRIVSKMETRKHVLKAVDCSLIEDRPVFSTDSKFLFVTCDTSVRIYSTETGHCVHKLIEKDKVKSVFVNPRNQLQLVVCTANGQISTWDYADCVKLKKYDINRPISSLWMPRRDGPILVVSQQTLLAIDDAISDSQEPRVKFVYDKITNPKMVSTNDQFVVHASDNKIRVYFIDSGEKTVNESSRKEHYTCVAAHPNEYCVATGNDIGKIFVWYNIQTKKYVKRSLHWHQLPVSDLCFTSSGAHLLSVGGECVLVKWKLNSESDVNEYTPRLGMPLRWVTTSSDGHYVATSHVDNAIHVLSGRGMLVLVIQGIVQSYLWQNPPVPTGLVRDPKSESLVLNGKPGHLQFYSLKEDKQLFNLDITYRNFHHGEREFDVDLLDVSRAAFDANGDWLATVEVRDDRETSIDVRLKFWKFAEKSRNFSLNTTVELPHSHGVNALVFRPSDGERLPSCVTTSDDAKFKIWALVASSDVKGNRRTDWTCDSGGYYRQEAAGDATFDSDGSVLAVVFGRAVTLWDPDTNAIKGTLYDPFCRSRVNKIEFGSGNSNNLLVSVTDENLVVWETNSSTVRTRIERKIVCLVKDPRTELMAIVDGPNSRLEIFTPDKIHFPVHRQQLDNTNIVTAIFFPRPNDEKMEPIAEWEEKSQLYLMDSQMQLFAVVHEQESHETKFSLFQKNIPENSLSILLAQKLKSETIDSNKSVERTGKMSELISQFYTAPTHTLPDVRTMCEILHSHVFLQKKKKENDGFELDKTEDEISGKKKRNDSINRIENDSFSTPNFDWLGKIFV